MTSPSTSLFVYGTLRNAFSNSAAMQLRHGSRYMGEGTMPGHLYDAGRYPGAIYRSDERSLVQGSVYALMANINALLATLDAYEGVSAPPDATDEYTRVLVPIQMTGRLVDCWVYLYNWSVDSLRYIESGDYVRYLNG